MSFHFLFTHHFWPFMTYSPKKKKKLSTTTNRCHHYPPSVGSKLQPTSSNSPVSQCHHRDLQSLQDLRLDHDLQRHLTANSGGHLQPPATTGHQIHPPSISAYLFRQLIKYFIFILICFQNIFEHQTSFLFLFFTKTNENLFLIFVN